MSDAKRNVDDVDYATAEGNRRMREVLQERKAKARSYTRAQLDAAYRERAGAIAMLQSCLCCYPFVRAETPSEHEAWCPSDGMRRSFEAARNHTGAGQDAPTPETTTKREDRAGDEMP